MLATYNGESINPKSRIINFKEYRPQEVVQSRHFAETRTFYCLLSPTWGDRNWRKRGRGGGIGTCLLYYFDVLTLKFRIDGCYHTNCIQCNLSAGKWYWRNFVWSINLSIPIYTRHQHHRRHHWTQHISIINLTHTHTHSFPPIFFSLSARRYVEIRSQYFVFGCAQRPIHV